MIAVVWFMLCPRILVWCDAMRCSPRLQACVATFGAPLLCARAAPCGWEVCGFPNTVHALAFSVQACKHCTVSDCVGHVPCLHSAPFQQIMQHGSCDCGASQVLWFSCNVTDQSCSASRLLESCRDDKCAVVNMVQVSCP